ncbi:MAG: ABC transporter substrate-binding protein [Dehalobacterium sp.]
MENKTLPADLLALMPCPLKLPMESKVSDFVRQLKADLPLTYDVISNAVMQQDVFAYIAEAQDIDDLPHIMIAPGFSRFFYPSFVKRFRDTGCFVSAMDFDPAEVFRREGLIDPKGCYDIIATNPLVFLVDKTRYPDLPTPRRWEDLLQPCYENKVAYRGHTEDTLCEGVLLSIYQEHGREGIKKLGASIKCRLHPSQMVALAGTHKDQAPAVSVLPLSFAHLVKTNDRVQVIWPEDGAIMNPVVMLTKKDCSQAVKALARYFLTREISHVFMTAGFYHIGPGNEGDMPRSGSFKWVGWGFLEQNDIGALIEELDRVANAAVLRGAEPCS